MTKRSWLNRLIALLFGGAFVYAGVVKALHPMTFLDDIRSFQLLPDPYAAWLALWLPWLEVFSGLAVVTGVLRQGGLLVLNGLLLVFLGVITLSWYRGLDIRCGCFGGGGEVSPYLELYLRDGLLLALGLWLIFCFTKPTASHA
jgi:putative oxidoreductase